MKGWFAAVRHISLWYIAGAVVVIGGGYFLFFGGSSDLGSSFTVSRGDFSQQVAVSGTVIAANAVNLGFSQSGRVSSARVQVGDHVGAGQVLAEVENADLRAGVVQKQAALAAAEANLASVVAGTRPEQVSIDQTTVAQDQMVLANAIRSAYVAGDNAVHADADQFFTNARVASAALTFIVPDSILVNRLVQERIALEPVLVAWDAQVSSANFSQGDPSAAATTALANLAQISSFLDDAAAALSKTSSSGSVTSTMLSSYQSAVAEARTSVGSARTTLTSASAALAGAQAALTLSAAGATPQSVAASEAQVQVAAADVASAEAQLGKTRIVAPFSGVITRMDAKIGQIISPTDSEISMMGNGLFQIETYIPEVAIAGVAVGNNSSTTLDAYGDTDFATRVVSVDPAETVKDGVPTYKTVLSFLSPDSRIRSGMTANATIIVGTLHDAVVIPAGAVGTKKGQSYVSLLVDKKAVMRPVQVGVSPSLGQVQIISGLEVGDVVLLKPE